MTIINSCPVRLARTVDVPCLVNRARVIHSASIHAGISFDPVHAAGLFARLIAIDEGCVLISKDGFFAGALTPFHFNKNHTRLIEIGWGGGQGKALIEAAQDWAKSRGAQELVLAVENTNRAKGMARLLRRNGGHPGALSFIWRL